jgi:hypothetical protein
MYQSSNIEVNRINDNPTELADKSYEEELINNE